MPNSNVSYRIFLLLFGLLVTTASSHAAGFSNKLALGATYGGGQVHWGFARKWALELRGLKGEKTDVDGTVTASVFGLRAYRYLRAPSRLRFYMGLEGAATRSQIRATNYKTTGFAAGGFFGSEIYLLKRLSVGVDVGPYLLSTSVRQSDTNNSEVFIVINSYMNFYFL